MKLLTKELKTMGMTHKNLARRIGVPEKMVDGWADGTIKLNVMYISKLYDIGVSTEAMLDPSIEV